MKKFFLPIIVVTLFAALLIAPSLGQRKVTALAPLPEGTASPRNWSKLTSDGELLPTAVDAESAILIDGNSGKVLYEKNADKLQYPASTTKIMTALVCLLNLPQGKDPSDITVTIGTLPQEDFASDSENIALKKGEKLTLKDLLSAMMVYSGNDVADAVALYTGGTKEHFVELMNAEAEKLGMDKTHFENPNGLADDTNHHTTARDMVKLATEAMKNPLFRKYVKNTTYKIGPTNLTDKSRSLLTTDWLLLGSNYGKKYIYKYNYILGIKTGYTGMAQNAFISAAQKDGQYLIGAVMHEDIRTDLWTDTVTMCEYGFKYYDTVDLKALFTDKTLPMTVKDASSDDAGQGSLTLTQKPQSQAYITGLRDAMETIKGDPTKLEQETTLTKDTAPIKQGETVGTVTYSYEGKDVLTCDLIAARDVASKATVAPTASTSATGKNTASGTQAPGSPDATGGAVVHKPNGAVSALLWVGAVILLILLAMLAIRIWNMQRRGRRNRQYASRQDSTRLRR
jgi:serine-type D-Ala-D-Ala carboxypeptidase (penicillin-binding protein 5/6)